MKLIEFTKHFPDEQICKAAFRFTRLKEGITCKKCGDTSHSNSYHLVRVSEGVLLLVLF